MFSNGNKVQEQDWNEFHARYRSSYCQEPTLGAQDRRERRLKTRRWWKWVWGIPLSYLNILTEVEQHASEEDLGQQEEEKGGETENNQDNKKHETKNNHTGDRKS